MKTAIASLRETLEVIELAETLTTQRLKKSLCDAAAEMLIAVASEIRTQDLVEAPINDTAEARGPSLYNQFISEMSAATKKALPKKSPKERFHILATLWTRHKALGDLQDIKAAAHGDLKALSPSSSTPVYSINMSV